jgi:organic radical activating enzyme
MSNLFQISEIFKSIQGEGFYVGKSMLFIRMAGCNRSCSFCDEINKQATQTATLENLVEFINVESYEPVFTGGEPLLQLTTNDLNHVVEQCDRVVHVETNGSILLDENLNSCVHLTISPKGNFNPDWINWIDKKFRLSWKLLVGEEGFIYPYCDTILERAHNVYLQPLWDNSKAMVNAITMVDTYPDRCRLSVQMHKYIGLK